MKLTSRNQPAELANIDDRIMPLINIVFLLLIFFLVAGVIKEVEPLEVEPPVSTANAEAAPADLTIYISPDGRIALGDEILPDDTAQIDLGMAVSADPDQSIRIIADQGVDTVKVIEILDTLRASGSTRVKLVTRSEVAR
jgi:biopolymer transport protein ExbD